MSTATIGQPGQDMGSREVALALDIGGTTLKGAVVDIQGRPLITHTIPTGLPGDGVMLRARALLCALTAESRQHGLVPIGIGVATPGTVNSHSGNVAYASSLGWSNMPLAEELSRDFGFPVSVTHDARAAGLAEASILSGSPRRSSVFVAIGTGVGAALIAEGRVLAGASYSAGELGHIPVITGGEQCTCGQYGCLEAYFSGAGLVRRYRARGGDTEMTAADIAWGRAGEAGEAVWTEGIRALALGLATVTLLTDPEIIIIGGGLSAAGDNLLKPLQERMSSILAWRRPPQLRRSVLGPRAGQAGAAILALEAAGFGGDSRWTAENLAAAVELELGTDAMRKLSLALNSIGGF